MADKNPYEMTKLRKASQKKYFERRAKSSLANQNRKKKYKKKSRSINRSSKKKKKKSSKKKKKKSSKKKKDKYDIFKAKKKQRGKKKKKIEESPSDESDRSSDSDTLSDDSVSTVSTVSMSKQQRQYSLENIKEKLKNYLFIHPNNWKDIELKTYIKYFVKKKGNPDFDLKTYKNEYRKGGFLQFKKKNQLEDGTTIWLFGLSWGFDKTKDDIHVVKSNKIKSLWKHKNVKIKPEIDEFASKIRIYQKTTTENQILFQDQIKQLQYNIEKLKENLMDNMSDCKGEIEKNREALEKLVEFIRNKINN